MDPKKKPSLLWIFPIGLLIVLGIFAWIFGIISWAK